MVSNMNMMNVKMHNMEESKIEDLPRMALVG
jgi:hypothetical protein